MESFIDFLKGFNTQTIISLIIIMIGFSRHIDAKFNALEKKIEQGNQRTDRLYEMFIDLLKKL